MLPIASMCCLLFCEILKVLIHHFFFKDVTCFVHRLHIFYLKCAQYFKINVSGIETVVQKPTSQTFRLDLRIEHR